MPRQQKNVNEPTNEPVNNNPIRNETESSPDDFNEQTPRRSARLMKRQRDNEEAENETEIGNGNGSVSGIDNDGNGNDTSDNNSNDRTSRNTRTRTSNSTSTDIRTSTSTASSTSNNLSSSTSNNASSNSASASTTAPAGQTRTARPRTTRPERSQSQSPFPFMSMPVPIVFSFGIRARPSNTENTGTNPAGTPDFHMIFNTNGPSTEELEQLIRNSTANGTGNTRVRTASFVFPLIRASTSPSTSIDPATHDFIQQMFTSMPQSTPATSANRTASDSGIDEEMETRLTEFARGIVQLMMTSRSNYADDEFNETLNNLVSRVFGAESVPRGITPERINALPVMEAGTEVDCAICRETSTAGAGAADKCVKLPCDHGFHFECIEPWLKRVSSCPICRSEIK